MYKLNSSVFEEAMTHLLEIFNIGEEASESTLKKEASEQNA